MANPISTAISTVRSAAPASLVTVSFKSQISPTINYDPASKQTTGKSNGFSDFLMGLIKPSIILHTPAGDIKSAPYGEPTSNYLPALVVAGSVGVLAILGLTFALGKKSAS